MTAVAGGGEQLLGVSGAGGVAALPRLRVSGSSRPLKAGRQVLTG